MIERQYRPISYEQLILNTKIKEDLHADLYAHLSMHTHPSYVGVIQNFGLSDEEIAFSRYSAIMYASFVTSFMMADLAKRFSGAKEYLSRFSPLETEVYTSVLFGGRED